MDNSPIMFKGAINGFDKKAVISYIFELNEANQAAQKKLTEQLEEALADKEALERQLADAASNPRLEGELESMSIDLNRERGRVAELTGKVAELNEEIEELKAQLREKDDLLAEGATNVEIGGDSAADELREKLRMVEDQLDEARQRLRSLEGVEQQLEDARQKLRGYEGMEGQLAEARQQLSAAAGNAPAAPPVPVAAPVPMQPVQVVAPAPQDADLQRRLRELEEKREEVERASAQIGRLLLDATADAERIRNDARFEAEKVLSKARSDAADIVHNATADSEAAVNEAGRRFTIFRQDLGLIQRTILDSVNAMEDKAKSINTVIDMLEKKMNTDLSERVDSSMAGLENKSDFFRYSGDK